jgi:hypothetical protein
LLKVMSAFCARRYVEVRIEHTIRELIRRRHFGRDPDDFGGDLHFTQIPGGDAAAGRLVLVAIAISLAALGFLLPMCSLVS